jgi:pimeloyl-ACP methyl ester carboxylesterase
MYHLGPQVALNFDQMMMSALEEQLAALPKISVPTIVIHGADDAVNPVQKSEGHHRYYRLL